jgi:hypothetical protein
MATFGEFGEDAHGRKPPLRTAVGVGASRLELLTPSL